MVGPIQQRGLDTHQRVTGQDAKLHSRLDALVNAGDVLARDPSTGDLVLELVHLAFGHVQRREGHLHLGVLA